MDWALISGVADTAAAFGVIGSLIFVGFQVRQNSASLHNAAAQASMAAYQNMTSHVIDSADVAELFFRGLDNPEDLEGDALKRFYAYVSKMLRTFQGMYWQWRQGTFDERLFISMTSHFEDFALTPGWQQIWRVRRHQYDSDFQEFIDKIMSAGEGEPLYPELAAKEG